MMRYSYCIFILLFSLMTWSSYAQQIQLSTEDLREAKKRKLLVVLEEEDNKLVKKLEKKDKTTEIKNYQKKIADYNANLKLVIKKFWKLHTRIEYTTPSKLEDMDKSKLRDQYVVLRGAVLSVLGSGKEARYRPVWGLDFSGEEEKEMDPIKIEKKQKEPDWLSPFSIILYKPIKQLGFYNTESWLSIGSLPSYNPSQTDLAFCVQLMQYYCNLGKKSMKELKKLAEVNTKKLVSKPLLMRKSHISG